MTMFATTLAFKTAKKGLDNFRLLGYYYCILLNKGYFLRPRRPGF